MSNGLRTRHLVGKFLIWRARNVSDRFFVLILSAIIGVVVGLSALLLKYMVFFISDLLTGSFKEQHDYLWYAVYPGIGIWLTVILIRLILKDNLPYGIPRILYVITRKKGKMKRHKPFGAIFGAGLTAGFGGSIGLESPIITAGSATGSLIAQFLRLNYRTTIILIGAGAAGAIASIFNTPIAAVIFCLEVLMLDLALVSVIPLLVASVAGAVTTLFFYTDDILIHFELLDKFQINDIPFYLLLGGICGLVSLYFNRISYWIGGIMESVKNYYHRAIIGAFALGLLIYFFPALYGEGYAAIKSIVANKPEDLLKSSLFGEAVSHQWLFILLVFCLMLAKVFATSITLESGGIGGVFAPSAMMGGLTGFVFARFVNQMDVGVFLSEANFTLVGMAGVLSGVLSAPLTAMFLIAELTNGYELIVPLMIITTIAFITVKRFDTHSVFTKKLAEQGDILSHHKDKTVLTLLQVKSVIDKDLNTISPNITLGQLVEVIAISHRNIFPVIDNDNTFLGLIAMDDVRSDMFKTEKYKQSIKQYIIQPMDHVSSSDTMEVVVEKFRQTQYYNLPVIDDGKYVGFVSKATLFGAYRQTLIDVSHE